PTAFCEVPETEELPLSSNVLVLCGNDNNALGSDGGLDDTGRQWLMLGQKRDRAIQTAIADLFDKPRRPLPADPHPELRKAAAQVVQRRGDHDLGQTMGSTDAKFAGRLTCLGAAAP